MSLGRDCQLLINGVVLSSVDDVYVRESVTAIPATVRNASITVSIPVQRSIEIDFALIAPEDVSRVFKLRTTVVDGTIQPNVVTVSLAGGVFNDTGLYTIHDVTGDEPLNGAVRARFALRQWIGMLAGPVGTAGNAMPPASANDALTALGQQSIPSSGATGTQGITGV